MPYNSDWPLLASSIAEKLNVLGPCLVTVHHIGSTSVPGLAAKPIIDLMPLVTDLPSLDRVRKRVEAIGYQWHGAYGISGRRYCTLSDETGSRIAQLHFFSFKSPHVARHLAFRNYLRAYPDVRDAYEAEKRRARELYPNDSHGYSDEKAPWIEKILKIAVAWFATQQAGKTQLLNHDVRR